MERRIEDLADRLQKHYERLAPYTWCPEIRGTRAAIVDCGVNLAALDESLPHVSPITQQLVEAAVTELESKVATALETDPIPVWFAGWLRRYTDMGVELMSSYVNSVEPAIWN